MMRLKEMKLCSVLFYLKTDTYTTSFMKFVFASSMIMKKIKY